MTESESEMPVFDDAVLTAVAAERDVTEAVLRDLVDEQTALITDFPGIQSVDDLVYEWRTAFFKEPLVERTADAYYLSVKSHVWTDFEERMDADADVFAAFRALHARIFEEYGLDAEDEPMVLVRD